MLLIYFNNLIYDYLMLCSPCSLLLLTSTLSEIYGCWLMCLNLCLLSTVWGAPVRLTLSLLAPELGQWGRSHAALLSSSNTPLQQAGSLRPFDESRRNLFTQIYWLYLHVMLCVVVF